MRCAFDLAQTGNFGDQIWVPGRAIPGAGSGDAGRRLSPSVVAYLEQGWSCAAIAAPLPKGGVATSSIICSQMIDRLGDFFELGVFFWGRSPGLQPAEDGGGGG